MTGTGWGEAQIMSHLDFHLNQGEPGKSLHHLTVVQAQITAFGTADYDNVTVTLNAMAQVGPGTFGELLAGTVLRSVAEAKQEKRIIVFAALSQELVVLPRDAPDQDLGRRLIAQGRPLTEHPHGQEVTMLYAACEDGRRWRGRRYLTGPMAGITEQADLLVGPPQRGEGRGIEGEALVRRLVGQTR